MAASRTVAQLAEEVVERCRWAKFTGNAGLTDYDPLVVVMHLVAEKIGKDRLVQEPKARWVWCQAMQLIQDDCTLDQNPIIPCRQCDQAFEPVIDDALLTMFLAWDQSFELEDLLALHKCPACGGQLKAERTTQYKGDMHTPEPRSVEDDLKWGELLLQYSSL